MAYTLNDDDDDDDDDGGEKLLVKADSKVTKFPEEFSVCEQSYTNQFV
jgi:hypothetical protein